LKTDADVITVLQIYQKDSHGTVQAIVHAMMADPDTSALRAFCRNVAQRCPPCIIDDIVLHLHNTSVWVAGGERYRIMENALSAAVCEENNRRAADGAPPCSSTAPSPSQSEFLVVVPVPIGSGLSVNMEALGCPSSIMMSESRGPNCVAYGPSNETSAMTDLEKQFVTDPVLIHLAQTRASLATLYTYLKHRYPALVKDRSESDMVSFWRPPNYPLTVLTLVKDKPYVRHIVTNSGSCPSYGGRYYFNEAPVPDPVVRF